MEKADALYFNTILGHFALSRSAIESESNVGNMWDFPY